MERKYLILLAVIPLLASNALYSVTIQNYTGTILQVQTGKSQNKFAQEREAFAQSRGLDANRLDMHTVYRVSNLGLCATTQTDIAPEFLQILVTVNGFKPIQIPGTWLAEHVNAEDNLQLYLLEEATLSIQIESTQTTHVLNLTPTT